MVLQVLLKGKQDDDDKYKQDDDKGKQGGDDEYKKEKEPEINIDEEKVTKGTEPKEPKTPDPIKTNKKKLPQTGTSDSKSLFYIGGLLALVLGIKVKRNKK